MQPSAIIFAQTDPQHLIIIAVIVAVTTLVLISTRRRLREGQPSLKDYTRQQRARLRDQQHVKQDMEELAVQLQQVARQINSQIDTRFAKLESCIADADQRIERMERLLRRAGGHEGVDVTVSDQSTPSPDQAEDRNSIRIDPMHREIYRLADEGKPPPDIARQLGRTTGEVELILNLRRDRHE